MNKTSVNVKNHIKEEGDDDKEKVKGKLRTELKQIPGSRQIGSSGASQQTVKPNAPKTEQKEERLFYRRPIIKSVTFRPRTGSRPPDCPTNETESPKIVVVRKKLVAPTPTLLTKPMPKPIAVDQLPIEKNKNEAQKNRGIKRPLKTTDPGPNALRDQKMPFPVKNNAPSTQGPRVAYRVEYEYISPPTSFNSIGSEVGKMLEELNQEFATDYANQSRHDWLTGSASERKEIIEYFTGNKHPSAKQLQEMAEKMEVTYRSLFYNFDRLRINHKIKCESYDNCRRIKRYFNCGSDAEVPWSLVPQDTRDLLEHEMNKLLVKDTAISVGRVHMLCDVTGLPPSMVRSQVNPIRKKFLEETLPRDKERAKIALVAEVEREPFPKPEKYQQFAKQFDMSYQEVQAVYNDERLKYVKQNGPYEHFEEALPEGTADAILDLAKQGKKYTHESMQKFAKRLGISYTTAVFWLDNYTSQINGAMEKLKSTTKKPSPSPSTKSN